MGEVVEYSITCPPSQGLTFLYILYVYSVLWSLIYTNIYLSILLRVVKVPFLGGVIWGEKGAVENYKKMTCFCKSNLEINLAIDRLFSPSRPHRHNP